MLHAAPAVANDAQTRRGATNDRLAVVLMRINTLLNDLDERHRRCDIQRRPFASPQGIGNPDDPGRGGSDVSSSPWDQDGSAEGESFSQLATHPGAATEAAGNASFCRRPQPGISWHRCCCLCASSALAGLGRRLVGPPRDSPEDSARAAALADGDGFAALLRVVNMPDSHNENDVPIGADDVADVPDLGSAAAKSVSFNPFYMAAVNKPLPVMYDDPIAAVNLDTEVQFALALGY